MKSLSASIIVLGGAAIYYAAISRNPPADALNLGQGIGLGIAVVGVIGWIVTLAYGNPSLLPTWEKVGLRTRLVIKVALCVCGIVIFWWLYRSRDGQSVLFTPSGAPTSWWEFAELVAVYGALLVGVVLGVLVRGLLERKSRGETTIEWIPYIRDSFRDIDVAISIFASPILFGGILHQGVSMDIMPFFFFALQTGFSSHLAIRSLVKMRPEESQRLSSPAPGAVTKSSSEATGSESST